MVRIVGGHRRPQPKPHRDGFVAAERVKLKEHRFLQPFVYFLREALLFLHAECF